ncbi:hypothetical protein COCC4DRAFT_70985 [Bipolaris maydis ATCC 48331]|uniref:Uncharacterized protein n=2 Tax=Cochliobolus heterostrophus TaxID=5016 RepID=M2UHZ2_COCH5|nr:uncharacterized protein COCC4DRAFT_70985 [Bipolaris maydis ATCC 48331]EMD87562.1 hypothetical protein COCHEDRAFT_1033961 [Bipolaris maydis C5]ENI06762.1 hypothetical protein COCC4DRAFT_70985 [Bipolaris maydis ATCC 48331]KAJ6212040.1 hypothetical protein PSV09DRAFT_1033961 [Bipolaris maydis]
MLYSQWQEEVLRVINYADVDVWRTGIKRETQQDQVIWFDTRDARYTFINSAETRFDDADFHAVDGECKEYNAHVTLDWRRLMTMLFAEENIVRKRLGSGTLSFWEYAEQRIRNILRSSGRRMSIGNRELRLEFVLYRRRVNVFLQILCWNDCRFYPLYTEALERRLRYAFDRDGGDTCRLEDVFDDVREFNKQLGSDRMQRRSDRLKDFAEGLWAQRWNV